MMNLKKLSLAALSLTLSVGLLAGCAGAPATKPSESPVTTPVTTPAATPSASAPAAAGAVKTGLSIIADVSASKNATADAEGQVQANIALVAVTVGEDGVIDACAIDGVQPKMTFDATGALTIDTATEFATKNELGEKYGMKKASPIGKEWNEQAAAFAAYAVGKTVADLKGIAVNEKGAATGADLTASVTIGIGGFIGGIEAAVNSATNLGAQKGDKLGLASGTNMSKSKNASADAEGQAQAYTTVSAVTMNGDKITSCYLDAVQATVKFNASGVISTDLAAPIPTKNELGENYGMKKASAIGKEWNEQAAAFSAYVTGKTVADVTGLAVNEKGGAADADLAASITVGIGEFQTLIEKAAK